MRLMRLAMLLAAMLAMVPHFGVAGVPEGRLTVVLDGTGGGKIFDGIGATSGGGASSRLLIDYPEPQRTEILDYLFTPNYGAALQMLKVEIGSDGNSGMGAEASHARSAIERNYRRGYEWWLMQEARRRNPSIKLLALAWNFPAWVGKPNSQATADYLVSFLTGAKREYDLAIDYIGIWNETPMDSGFIKLLRSTLDAAHLQTKIIADDLVNDWGIVDKMEADLELRAAVNVIATHYPRTESPQAVRERAASWGKPLWSSEDGPWDDAWGATGTQSTPLAELLNRNYIHAGITSTNVWNLATAYYDILDYTNAGLMRANKPWSGHYGLTSPMWVVAHTTQFAQPGWHYIDSSSAMLPRGGSYVTLHSGAQYSVIAETISARRNQRIQFELRGGLAHSPVHVWRSTATDSLQQVAAITPRSDRFTFTLEPGSVYSLTTTTGQHKGTALPPADRPFPVPYREDFEGYPVGTDAVRYLSEQNGAFEVARCTAGRHGQCLSQVAERPPIWWTYGADAPQLGTPTILGDPRWRDYRVSVEALISGDGYASILGRVTRVLCCDGTLSAYQFRIYGSGKWELLADSRGVPLTAGAVPQGTQPWRHLELQLLGDRLTGFIDGTQVFRVDDAQHGAGLAGISAGWNAASFDDFEIAAVAPGVAVISPLPVHVLTGPPDPPKLYVPVASRNAVRLTWSAVAGVERYRIGLRDRHSDHFRFIEVGKVTSYTVTTLTNGVAYRFQIVALNSNGESKPSEEQTGTPTASE